MIELLEREDELAVLTRTADEAAAGRGSLVLVAGEAGIGKSSLLRALRERLAQASAFLLGDCRSRYRCRSDRGARLRRPLTAAIWLGSVVTTGSSWRVEC